MSGPDAQDGSTPDPADAAGEVEERRRRADRATKGALAGVLGLEAVTTLLVPRALAFSEGGLGVTKTVLLAVLAVAMVLAAGMLRRPRGIGAGTALQVLFLLSGLWLLPLLVIAALFAAVWVRLLFLRTEVAGTRRDVSLLWS